MNATTTIEHADTAARILIHHFKIVDIVAIDEHDEHDDSIIVDIEDPILGTRASAVRSCDWQPWQEAVNNGNILGASSLRQKLAIAIREELEMVSRNA